MKVDNPKNSIQFIGKKYADEIWLYDFKREESSNEIHINDAMFSERNYHKTHSDASSKSANNNFKKGKSMNMLKKFIHKYHDDLYVLANNEIDFSFKSWPEVCKMVMDKLIGYPDAQEFIPQLNKELLGDFYNDYMKVIKKPMDFTTINNNLENDVYQSYDQFHNDLMLVFSNCKEFNAKDSILYYNANKVGDYYNMLYEFIKDIDFNKIDMEIEDMNEREDKDYMAKHNGHDLKVNVSIIH